ncbi:MAG TPA: acetyl-CoA carboxylase biotin carboxyl carrier protein subunit, partial [Ramlibacter sp.]|nr:acetyl-CoA carboxylase biotin carboxyl carrier protein subunit [Ramlibacter sp.]
MTALRSPLQAQVVQWLVAPGDPVRSGDVVVILEAMKMEHEVRAPSEGRVKERLFAEGETVGRDEVLLVLEAGAPTPALPQGGRAEDMGTDAASAVPPSSSGGGPGRGHARPDLKRVLDRHALTLDA